MRQHVGKGPVGLNRLSQRGNTWGMNSRRNALWVGREAEHRGNCEHRL
jgi:hypothetical protein